MAWGAWSKRFGAGVDESERVPESVGDEFGCEREFSLFDQERGRGTGDSIESFVAADAVEPVMGVAIVGFAAMDDRMEEAAGRAGDFLGQGMGILEVIVPEQSGGDEGGTSVFGDSPRRDPGFELSVQFDSGDAGGARVGAQIGEIGYFDELKELTGEIGHGGIVVKAMLESNRKTSGHSRGSRVELGVSELRQGVP